MFLADKKESDWAHYCTSSFEPLNFNKLMTILINAFTIAFDVNNLSFIVRTWWRFYSHLRRDVEMYKFAMNLEDLNIYLFLTVFGWVASGNQSIVYLFEFSSG